MNLVGGESTQPGGTLVLDNEQLGGESAQAGSPVAVRGQVDTQAGDINNVCEGVEAVTGGEGSSGAAWGGAKQAVRPGRLRPVAGSKTWLPHPLPSSPRTLRSRAAKVTAEAVKAVEVPVAGPSKQTRRAAKKARQVLNRI